jgi:hypothetical protein
MTRGVKIGLAVLSGLILAWFVLWSVQRRQAFEAAAPGWLNPGQPPDGVAAPLTAAQSYAANRCRPMTACCTGRTAGMRTRRTYPPTVAGWSGSFLSAGFNVMGGSDGR